MFWKCEQYSKSWWDVFGGTFRCCQQLLKTIIEWMKETSCPNFFLPTNNMFANLPTCTANTARTTLCILKYCDTVKLCKLVLQNDQYIVLSDCIRHSNVESILIYEKDIENFKQWRDASYATFITSIGIIFGVLPGLKLYAVHKNVDVIDLQNYAMQTYLKVFCVKDETLPMFRISKRRLLCFTLAISTFLISFTTRLLSQAI